MRRALFAFAFLALFGFSSVPTALGQEAGAEKLSPEEVAAEAAAEADAQAALEEAEAIPPPPPPPEPKTLGELLELVQEGFQQERVENQHREQEFRQAKERQAQLLADAMAVLASQEALSERLEKAYNRNEGALGEAEAEARLRRWWAERG